MTETDRCPCGSREPFAACCGPLLDGAPAPTAERLMRSRYTAFALGRTAHLLRTWDPATRPASLELEPGVVWRGLRVVDTWAGGPDDDAGVVEFRAAYRDADGAALLAERSRFVRRGNDWYVGPAEVSVAVRRAPAPPPRSRR
ncbi:YchJ family metal-binding protein [Amnibacterium sp. CER49]|uniref:YchJ family protein n=1 Tax=Amnibacterium sp. CER49 TaxID=3039161 RepID=UPI00244A9756|nr:YchJ family metal-binding protein [Amnibacterium sp. CER49]MDH2444785.1 YchJ family metal-binding protein [Amnibacterium sp. CER49]